VLGSGVDRPGVPALARAVADRHGLAVACTAKRQHLYDNTDPYYAGHLHIATPPAQRAALAEADLIVALGSRLDAVTTRGFSFPTAPVPAQRLVQVHADPAAIGRVYTPFLGVAADPVATLRTLSTMDVPDPARHAARRGWVDGLHALEVAESTWAGDTAADGVVFGDVVAALDRLTGGTATVAVDAGNFTSWLHRYYRFRDGGRLLGIAPGAMGFGVPAGLAAALRHPEAQTVAVVGDGGVLMTGAELATAVARRARLRVLIADNGSYGTIRAHQERAYPGRVIATDLANPDFARWAEAHGALGLAVETPAEVEPALRGALAHDGPAVVTVRTSLTHISAYGRIS
ncbi:MAG: thiamine pyrophosphate-dependent enzyme, partial [Actinocatenispora sp.]